MPTSDGMVWKDILSAIGPIMAILTFLYAQKKIRNDLDKATDGKIISLETKINGEHEYIVNDFRRRLDDHEAKIDELLQLIPKVGLFWDIVRVEFPKMLMHPTEQQRDLLLAKMSDDTITLDEAVELLAILSVEYEHYTPDERKETHAFINLMTRHVLRDMIKARQDKIIGTDVSMDMETKGG